MASILSRLSARLPASPARLAVVASALIAAATPVSALPEVQKVVSPAAGIEAWLMELNDAPLITFRFSFEGGALQDADGKYGTAHMAAYLFDEGAGPYDSVELKRRLTRIGALLSAVAHFEFFSVGFSTPSAYKDEALELLRLALHAPRFDDEPFGRARASFLSGIEALRKDPGSVAVLALWQRLLGKHPMATDWTTRKAGYESIAGADIAAYRRRVLARDNLRIAVAGNIDAAALAPLLDRLFGSLPAKAELRPVPAPTGAVGTCEAIAMDVPQAVVQFGRLTPPLTWQQRRTWQVLHSVLSEGVSAGRLTREVRERRGLVYGIGTGYNHYAPFGVFGGSFAAKVDDVPKAIALTRAELRRMADEGPTDEEVATVKRTIVGRFLLGLDNGAALANLMLNRQHNDRPITFFGDAAREIEKITRRDVWDVAKLLLKPDRLGVTIVGAPTQAKLCEHP
jgi:zinc protease